MRARAQIRDVWGRVRVAFLAARANRRVEHYEVDPGITYPSYKSFDDIIDVERLKSLDGYLVKKIREQLQRRDQEQFHAGTFKLRARIPVPTKNRASTPSLWACQESALAHR